MMRKAMLLGVTLVLAAAAGGGQSLRAAGADTGAIVVRWNQLLQSTLPPPGNPLTPRTYALMHIAMFDAISALGREYDTFHFAARPRDTGPPTPLRRRQLTTSSSSSTRRRPPRMTRRWPPILATTGPDSPGAVRNWAAAWLQRPSPGGRTTAGSCR